MSGAGKDRSTGPGGVVIAGMHRSGTSMVAKALRLAGLELGPDAEMVSPAPDNPDGFFEHTGFVNLDDDLLAATGGAWDHLPPHPPAAADDFRVERFRERALELVGELSGSSPWGFKDPRASLTIRFWLDLVPDLRVVVCVRNPLAVALSLKRRNNTSYAHGISLWHGYYSNLVDAVSPERRMVTHYDAHFADPEGQLARLVEFAGLPPEAATAGSAADPEQRHHRIAVGLGAAGLDPGTIELYKALREEAGDPLDPGEARAEPTTPASVDRNALDLHLARVENERRGRQVATLEQQRDELAARIDGLATRERLAAVNRRVEQLEGRFAELHFTLLEIQGNEDVDALRACRELLAEAPRDDEVLVIAKGDPAWLALDGRPLSNFPVDASGRYPGFTFADSVGAIAHLEARRAGGASFLLMPEASAWWREQYPGLTAHLEQRYEVVADEPGAGMLVDLRRRRRGDGSLQGPLDEAIAALADSGSTDPSVLDWTGAALTAQLPGRNVFAPPEGEALPYLERSIDVVLIDASAAERRRTEARRVAARAVLEVEVAGPPRIVAVEAVNGGPRAPARVTFVPVGSDPDPGWLARLEEAVASEPGAELISETVPWSELPADRAVALVEPGTVPLPGACDAALRTLATDGIGAVACKLLAADGSLEAAGTAVFADATAAGIAAGSHETVAPWHDYVRDVCAGAGMLFIAAAATADLPGDASAPPAVWSGSLWAAGRRVLYQPEAAAVRITEPPDPADGRDAIAQAWAPVLELRPERPPLLDVAAWRSLVARDDVAGAWLGQKQRA